MLHNIPVEPLLCGCLAIIVSQSPNALEKTIERIRSVSDSLVAMHFATSNARQPIHVLPADLKVWGIATSLLFLLLALCASV